MNRSLARRIELARDAGLLSRAEVQRGDRLLAKLEGLLGRDEEPSALLHGDLWSGNLHTDARGLPALIDPAAYFGHREAEFGMMSLFGGFSARTYAAYDEVFPRAPGHGERTPLYRLYHLLNHANLFGGSYVGQAMDLVSRYAA